MRGIAVDRQFGLVIPAVVAVVVITVALMDARETPSPGRRGVGGDRTQFGITVDVATAVAMAAACDCPVPGPDGKSGLVRG
jgi:hypothetical protein